jgi:EAL domain-containing protein (putative c-di-GMP-specific phosphodiesterase class I)
VNLSLQQLRGPAASTHIAELLEEWVPPGLIQLEVTESMLMLEPSIVEHCLTHLQRTGFGLSIDDFGTGYSSLSRLQHMPMHTLKIDKRFLDGLPHENSSVAVVNTILHLGHWTAPFCQHNSSGNLG